MEVTFLIIAAVMSVGAVRLVTTKNLVHGALYLVVTLFGSAVFFLIALAEFVAWVQVLIYVGAVIVLLLFGLMLTRAPIGRTALDNENRGFALLVSGGLFVVSSVVLWRAFDGKRINLDTELFSSADLGTALFTRFVLPFEIVSVLLLAALVGAVILAKKD